MDGSGSTLGSVVRSGFLILLFEFCGSVALTVFQRMLVGGIGFVLAYWFVVAIWANISGSHFNPAVTLTFMVRKEPGKFTRILGIAYMLAQLMGWFGGAMLAYMFTTSGGNLTVYKDSYIFQAWISETFGSFLYIFTFLIQTEKETRFSHDSAIWSLIISAAYGSVITYNYDKVGGSMNPAYGFAVHMTMLMDYGGEYLKYIWIYLIFPFVGGILALLFHEFVYKKTQVIVEQEYQERLSRREGMIPKRG